MTYKVKNTKLKKGSSMKISSGEIPARLQSLINRGYFILIPEEEISSNITENKSVEVTSYTTETIKEEKVVEDVPTKQVKPKISRRRST